MLCFYPIEACKPGYYILYNIKTQLQLVRQGTTQFVLGDVLSFSSSKEMTTATRNLDRRIKWRNSMYGLYCRISPVRDPTVSIVPKLDQWVEEGRPVHKDQLKVFIKQLRSDGRLTHALEVSMWMTDKRYFTLTVADIAIRLDLITKVKGIEQAQSYFSNVPQKLRVLEVYSALLNCYVHAKSVKKAEATMQKMRDLGLAGTRVVYNSMFNLYYRTGNYEKLESLMHELKEKGIGCNKYTFGICLSAYAAASDSEGIDKTVAMMESDPIVILDWSIYANAANGYAKAGFLEKAFGMLKKSEGLIFGEDVSRAYNSLITQYATCGKRDEVLRVWELYKKKVEVNNKGYMCIIPSVLKFDDLESAEKIFEEWESQNLSYDIRIPNFLISAYCKNGLLLKAEMLISRAKLKWGKPQLTTWYYMAVAWYYMAIGYLQNNQSQKAVEAMKQVLAVYRTPSKWKPSFESLSACLDYFKYEGDMKGADNFVKLLIDKDIIPTDLQDRLLKNVQNGKSKLDALRALSSDSLIGNEEPLSEI